MVFWYEIARTKASLCFGDLDGGRLEACDEKLRKKGWNIEGSGYPL